MTPEKQAGQQIDFLLNQAGWDDLNPFNQCYDQDNRHNRQETEHFGQFRYDEFTKRDTANLDMFWLRDESVEDSTRLPSPNIITQEILEDLRSAVEQLDKIAVELTPGLAQAEDRANRSFFWN